MGSTVLKKGVKLDNFVQIAHNVEIGENTVIAAMSGVAGSTTIGKNCMFGGHAGVVGHLTVADGVKIVGMGRVIGDERLDFYIKDIIVIPEYQGRHIGNRIMGLVMGYINENAVDRASVVLMSATGNEEFYRKFGFTERPNSSQGAGMNLVIRKDGSD